jgi:hypothetical protein
MYRHSRLAGTIVGCAATLAIVGCATNTGFAPVGGMTTMAQVQSAGYGSGWVHDGKLTYHVPHYMVSRNHAQPAVSGILFSYYDGPVLVTPHQYLIFWGYQTYGDPDKVAPLLKAYMKRMGGSSHDRIYDQYYETLSGKNIYITDPRGERKGVWFDQTNAVPANPTDAQVAAEALQGVAKFGYDANGSYIVATPTGHSTSGFGTQWCAYHSNTFSGSKLVSYTNLPYMPDAGQNCGSDFIAPPVGESSTDEGVTIVAGHEQGESVTDPNPGTGWYNFQYGEIGDACAWAEGSPPDQVENDKFGKKSYTMQPMYSNATESCVQSYAK